MLWTYLLPLVPLVILFDGLVSCMRTYNVQDLHDLTARLGTNDYHWDIGKVKGKTWIPITYLLGIQLEKPLRTPPDAPACLRERRS